MDDLPIGWTKEIQTRKYAGGFVKDTFYTDPENRYVFRSKKDVFRYLQTGNILSCAVKPRKKDMITPAIPAPRIGDYANHDFNNGAGSHGPATNFVEEELPENSSGSADFDEGKFPDGSHGTSGEFDEGKLPENSSLTGSHDTTLNIVEGKLPENSFGPTPKFVQGKLLENSFGPTPKFVQGKLPQNSSGLGSNTNLGGYKRKSIDLLLPNPTSKRLGGLFGSCSKPYGLPLPSPSPSSGLFNFMSDPCYNFAVRTLKGEIPIESFPQPNINAFSPNNVSPNPLLLNPLFQQQAMNPPLNPLFRAANPPLNYPLFRSYNTARSFPYLVDRFSSIQTRQPHTFYQPPPPRRANMTWRSRVVFPELAAASNAYPIVNNNNNSVNHFVPSLCHGTSFILNQSSGQSSSSAMPSLYQSHGSEISPPFNMQAENSNAGHNNYMDSSTYEYYRKIFPDGATNLMNSILSNSVQLSDFDHITMSSSSESSSSSSSTVVCSAPDRNDHADDSQHPSCSTQVQSKKPPSPSPPRRGN